MPSKKYIPALRLKILTPLFDPFIRLLMRETALKSRLIAQLNLQDGDRVLDFGCGTGTLTIMMKKAKPGSVVTGIDVDPEVLEIARGKARRERADIGLVEYDGVALPFADGSIDKVVTSLVLHHLSTAQKLAAFGEIYRVLRQGGELHILDFGVQKSGTMKILARFAGQFEPIEDNVRGRIPAFLSRAGFEKVQEKGTENTSLGSVSFYSAARPG
jgi:ubiquinone/menaquinone biosynthesis C-methylase UbiE